MMAVVGVPTAVDVAGLQEALAEQLATLLAFQPLGWHHWTAYGRFREAALRRVESASTIGVNA